MGLIDEARALMTVNSCATCAMMNGNKKLAGEIQDALDDHTVHISKIALALAKRGIKASESSLSKHRKGGCASQLAQP